MARRVVRENVIHPDHDGVVGDLIRAENGQYFLEEYVPHRNCTVPYTVPHAWARRQDPNFDPTERRPQRGARETFVDPNLNPDNDL
jgi:hypothetical protein